MAIFLRIGTTVLATIGVFAAGMWFAAESDLGEAQRNATLAREIRARANTLAMLEPLTRSGFEPAPRAFLDFVLDRDPTALERIRATWTDASLAYAFDALRFLGGAAQTQLLQTMAEAIGDFDPRTNPVPRDVEAWRQYIWQQTYTPAAQYGDYKSVLYRERDERFVRYFAGRRDGKIRLDEVRWGGVQQDGIPPLRQPKMISAPDAAYLEDDHIVFGIEVNGDVRAYPKRILAWHEMFVDTVGGVDLAGVYCTLCGTVILYETTVHGKSHDLGTSGFLYRSNKLMYDVATQSLWNTVWGEPVIGPLATAEPPIRLPRRPVVTTTWGAWRTRHPNTTVLSLETGYPRNYSEGEAYRDYFATDKLMFSVPGIESARGSSAAAPRPVANKLEVLGLTFPEAGREALAIDAQFLANRDSGIYADTLGPIEFVILTDASGANRVYRSDGRQFERYDREAEAVDQDGRTWQLTEAALVGPEGVELPRLPAQRAFWFGWKSAFDEVRLVR